MKKQKILIMMAPGRVLFELGGVDEVKAKEALRLASHKLPCKVKFVKRETAEVETVVEENVQEVVINEAEGTQNIEQGGNE